MFLVIGELFSCEVIEDLVNGRSCVLEWKLYGWDDIVIYLSFWVDEVEFIVFFEGRESNSSIVEVGIVILFKDEDYDICGLLIELVVGFDGSLKFVILFFCGEVCDLLDFFFDVGGEWVGFDVNGWSFFEGFGFERGWWFVVYCEVKIRWWWRVVMKRKDDVEDEDGS